MHPKLIQVFIGSLEILLLSCAACLFVYAWATAGLVQPHDPVFGLSIRYLFWIIAGISLGMALTFLFGEGDGYQTMWLAWLATNMAAYRLGLFWTGCPLNGFLGSFPNVFGVPTQTAAFIADGIFAYLLLGSYFLLFRFWLLSRKQKSSAGTNDYLMSWCPTCGGQIEFFFRNLGQLIPCPHCATTIRLRRPDEYLKISCYFCKGHIAFPSHAIGTKMPCPHCKMDITLKEPA